MEQEILKDWQKKAIEFIASAKELDNFYLTGGTALAAFYLQHRVSDDLDFFSYSEFDPIFIHKISSELKNILAASQLRFSRIHDRFQFFYQLNDNEVKIEFLKYPFQQLNPVNIINSLRVDSEEDIASNKLMTILDRFDPKDFVDLYFLLQKFELQEIKNNAEKKFNLKIQPLFLGSELSKVRRIEILPKMLKPLTVDNLKSFFSEEVKKISSEIIK